MICSDWAKERGWSPDEGRAARTTAVSALQMITASNDSASSEQPGDSARHTGVNHCG